MQTNFEVSPKIYARPILGSQVVAEKSYEEDEDSGDGSSPRSSLSEKSNPRPILGCRYVVETPDTTPSVDSSLNYWLQLSQHPFLSKYSVAELMTIDQLLEIPGNNYQQMDTTTPTNGLCRTPFFRNGNLFRDNLKRSFQIDCSIHFRGINSLCKNSENEVIVADTQNNKLHFFGLNGRYLRSISKLLVDSKMESECNLSLFILNRPDCVYICPLTGNLVVIERPSFNVIKVITPYGALKTYFQYEAKHPQDLCVDHNGQIILLDSKGKRVYIYKQEDGCLVNSFKCRDMGYPFNIAVNIYEEIFICDNEKHCVQVFNYDGEHLRTIGCKGIIDFPVSVKIGRNNEVVVCNNYEYFRITVFDRFGSIIVVALQTERSVECCYDVVITNNGQAIASTKSLKLVYMSMSDHALNRLNRLSPPETVDDPAVEFTTTFNRAVGSEKKGIDSLEIVSDSDSRSKEMNSFDSMNEFDNSYFLL